MKEGMDKERCVCVGIGVILQAGQPQGPEVGMSLKNWIIIFLKNPATGA